MSKQFCAVALIFTLNCLFLIYLNICDENQNALLCVERLLKFALLIFRIKSSFVQLSLTCSLAIDIIFVYTNIPHPPFTVHVNKLYSFS